MPRSAEEWDFHLAQVSQVAHRSQRMNAASKGDRVCRITAIISHTIVT